MLVCTMIANNQIWSAGTMNATAFNTYPDATLKTNVADVDLSGVFDAVAVKAYARTDKPELGRRVGFLAQGVRGACSSARSARHVH